MTDLAKARNMELRNQIAHILTGLCGSTCCHKTGGYGGKPAEKGCDCLDAADQIIALPAFAKMRQVLGECASDLADELAARYPENSRCYPREARRYSRDMAIVNEARALLK